MATYKGTNKDENGNILLAVPANMAPVETTLTASQAYTEGEYFIYSNNLYVVTSAIASGGTIIIGTNASLVPSIGAEVSKLNSSLNVKYDPSTDMIKIFYNGDWKDWKRAYFTNYSIYGDGAFYNGFWLGGQAYCYTGANHYTAITFQDSQLRMYAYLNDTQNWDTGSWFTPAIDLTNYTTLTVELTDPDGNNHTVTADVTALSGSYYLGIGLTTSYGNTYELLIGLSNTTNTVLSSCVKGTLGVSGIVNKSTATIINAIYIE